MITRVKTIFTVILTIWVSLNSGAQTVHSVARSWNEVLLTAIRNDFARPTVHARNLYHLSAMSYDVWAAYNPGKETYFLGKEHHGYFIPFEGVQHSDSVEESIEKALSYASYRLLFHRFNNSPGFFTTLQAMDSLMDLLEYDVSITSTDYINGGEAEFGNYIAEQIIAFGLQDGSNEALNFANQYYTTVNDPIEMVNPGNPDMIDPNRWQKISLPNSIDQSGNPVESAPPHLSPEWGNVQPFAMHDSLITVHNRNGFDYQVYNDLGAPPYLDTTIYDGLSSLYKWNFCMVAIWQSHLDTADGVMWDISPGSIGNIPSYPTSFEDYDQFYDYFDGGELVGTGYAVNPVTGLPYDQQIVRRGDYARVLAEFWADGLDSETPPGHWFEIFHTVSDHPLFEKKWMGIGDELSDLEFDIKAHFILGGAMHDAAITAWSMKGWYDYVRPASAIRYMGEKGQCSDPLAMNYHPAGLPIVPGYIEQVLPGDPLEGSSGEHVGKMKLYTWKGPDFITDPEVDAAGVGWILSENWWPYQRPTFVTPPFAGFISGHSTFSSSAAELLTLLTGSPYFPGGMSDFEATANEFLVFEQGPSSTIKLQWATYRDASDQCSLSRIWGGIHPPADDIPGRIVGREIGENAFNFGNEIIQFDRPFIDNYMVSDSILNIDFIGNTLELTFIFNEEMDMNTLPQINYLVDDVLENSLLPITVEWIDSVTFGVSYQLLASQEELLNIVIQIDSAKRITGEYQLPHLYKNIFVIDTKRPELTAVQSSSPWINSEMVATGFDILLEFNEPCDTANIPSIDFTTPPLGLGSSLTYNPALSYWISINECLIHYDVIDNNEIVPLVNFEVSQLFDVHQNAIDITEVQELFTIDTKKPLLTNITINQNVFNIWDVGQDGISILLEFDKPMETSFIPNLEFLGGTPLNNAITFNAFESSWTSNQTCLIVYDLYSSGEEFFDLDISLINFKDTSNNTIENDVVENLLTIDTKRPVPTSTSSAINYIFDGVVGTSGYEIIVEFSEPMNTSQIPLLSLTHPDNISSSVSYNAFTSFWESPTLFNAKFNVFDQNIEKDNLLLTINFARDLSGNEQVFYEEEDFIHLDTKNPTVIVLNANTYEITDNHSEFSILSIFDEEMDTNFDPAYLFSPAIAPQIIEEDLINSGWLNNTTYNKVYTPTGQPDQESNISIELENARDIAGNLISFEAINDFLSTSILQVESISEAIPFINVFPNPMNSGDVFTITSSINLDGFTGEITDNLGRKVVIFDINSSTYKHQVSVPYLATGLYRMHLKKGHFLFDRLIMITQ